MNDLPEIVGLQELSELLEVGPRTPHAWQYRKLLPSPDYASINGLRAWKIETIMQWAADTGRVTDRMRPYAPAPRANSDAKGGRVAKAEPAKPKTGAEIIEDASPSNPEVTTNEADVDSALDIAASIATAATENEQAGPGPEATWTVRDDAGSDTEAVVEVHEPVVKPAPIHASGLTFERGPDGRLRQVGV
jgi:hypothetical protein